VGYTEEQLRAYHADADRLAEVYHQAHHGASLLWERYELPDEERNRLDQQLMASHTKQLNELRQAHGMRPVAQRLESPYLCRCAHNQSSHRYHDGKCQAEGCPCTQFAFYPDWLGVFDEK
jgi:hypothetical protein